MNNTSLKSTNFCAMQGDTQWYEIETLPESAKRIPKRFIAQSESSGHGHALCGDYEMYETPEKEIFIKVGSDGATLNHTGIKELTPEIWSKNKILPVKDHKPSFFKEGTYFVGIQKRKQHFEATWKNVSD